MPDADREHELLLQLALDLWYEDEPICFSTSHLSPLSKPAASHGHSSSIKAGETMVCGLRVEILCSDHTTRLHQPTPCKVFISRPSTSSTLPCTSATMRIKLKQEKEI